MNTSPGPIPAPFRAGDRAVVTRGQFEGYEVEVIAVDEPRRTIRVSMTVFGRPVPLSFSFTEAVALLGPLPWKPTSA